MSIPPSARPTLLQLVEEHITSLIRDAVTVQRHCKRARWNPPLHPPGSDPHVPANPNAPNSGNYFKTRLHAADINLALELQGSEKLYGTVYPMHSPGVDPQSKVMLSDILREDVPPPPEEVSMQQHWLVVDGKPTDTPQHPDIALGGGVVSTIHPDRHPVGALEPTYESSEVVLQVHQLQSGLLSEELKLYFLRVVTTIERGGATQYDRNQQDLIMHQLEHDDGLQELVPFLVRYAQHSIYEQLVSNTEHSIIIVRLLRALLSNPTLHLELHLHEILPALMTCIVAQSLSDGAATSPNVNNNHWNLRQEAATTLAVCCSVFGTEYATLKSRILRALCQSLDVGSLPSRYGGIVAIALFGGRAIDAFLLPLLADCWGVWEEELEKSSLSKQMETDIIMCQQALLTGMNVYLRCASLEEKADRLIELKIDDILGGDRMSMLSADESEYNTCFV